MFRFFLALVALCCLSLTAEAQYRRSYSYGHSYYKPSYSYPSYSYPSYSYPKSYDYSYTWYDGSWWKGRWYPAGYYYSDGYTWYRKGYGTYYGEDRAAGPPPAAYSHDPSSHNCDPELLIKIRQLLNEKQAEKPKAPPLSPEELKKLKELLEKK
jgi:hypothetical protein